jgi:hypothetical protein
MKLTTVNIRNVFLALMLFLLTFILMRNKVRENKLVSNHLVSYGKLIKVDFGSNNGGGIMYKIDEITTDKLAFDNVGGSKCETHISAHLKEAKKVKFPVVYNPDDHFNSEILIFEDQYENYKIQIPDELIEIVQLLSNCR